MAQQFKNSARSILASDIDASATSLAVEAAAGDLFPVANMGTGTSGDWFKATLELETGEREIIKVRTRASGSDILSNIVRAQEGTTALVCPAGTVIGLRMTAEDVQSVLAVDWSMIPTTDVALVGGLKKLTYACRGRRINTDDKNVQIPAGIFADGDVIALYNNTLVDRGIYYDVGVFLVWSGGVLGPRLLQPYGLCQLHCLGSNIFRIVGDGVA